MMVVSVVSMIHQLCSSVFSLLWVDPQWWIRGTKSCDVLLVEWEDWEDLVISNDIIGVVLELLKYFSGSTCTTLLMRIYRRSTLRIYGCPTI